ncbi:hypothetical protein MOX02_36230 [Methylobacterium oxalidis]|uniref:Uncharacterized protein n=1 Tax=Methylobacterium oxalidis TaxID=944322 RepID=A0A512J6H6_9HYPH|nr:hypothetical protein MOX02_36230 [Methylobacterium oxalidis]GLS65435.1 hypothetical protein GCM10007888_38170 [Methylobacterium oxalidis]
MGSAPARPHRLKKALCGRLLYHRFSCLLQALRRAWLDLSWNNTFTVPPSGGGDAEDHRPATSGTPQAIYKTFITLLAATWETVRSRRRQTAPTFGPVAIISLQRV